MKNEKGLADTSQAAISTTNYNKLGFKTRQSLGCIFAPDNSDFRFDASVGECEEFGNDIRRSSWLISYRRWPEIHDYPSSLELRNLMRNAEANGLQKVLCRWSGILMIHEGKFFRWLERRQQNAK